MTVENLNISVKTNADKAADKLDKLSAALKGIKEAADGVVLEGGVVAVGKAATQSKKEVEALSGELQNTIRNASKYQTLVAKAEIARDKMNEAFKNGDEDAAWSAREREINAVAQAAKELEREQAAAAKNQPQEVTPVPIDLQGIIQSANEVDILRNKLDGLKAALQEAFESGNTEKAWALQSQILSTAKSLDKAEEAARKAASGIEEVGKAANKTDKPLGYFLSSLKRIAFYRIIRGIIKSITQAFTEGLEKAYLFSAGIQDAMGHRFAAAMDSLKSSTNAMKGQLGSAFISLLAAIEPILNRIIDLVIRVADAISQLFAAFTGTTYLKAEKTTAKFVDNMKSGGRAAKEWKNQLLGFDEINLLNEPSNGGGGGGTNPLAGYEMVDTPINEGLLKFVDNLKQKLQPAIDRCKEAFDRLKEAWNNLSVSLSQDGDLSNLINDLLVLGGDLILNGITALTDAFTLLLDILTALQTGDWTPVWEGLTKVFQDLWQAVWDLVWDGLIVLADAIDALIPGEQNLADKLRSIKDGTWEVEVATENGAKEMYTFADAAADAQAKLSGKYRPELRNTSTAQQDVTNTASNGVGFLSKLVDWCRRAHDAIQDVLNGVAFLNASGGGRAHDVLRSITSANGFATGGFPEEGELFIARESGAELVGSMGGRAAVANNDQIVEGIRQGVYDAVIAANNNGSGDVSVKVYLDSREIKAGQQRLNRAWGV